MNSEVERSLTSHRLSNSDRAPAYRKPRIKPRSSSSPVSWLIPDLQPLMVTKFVWQRIEYRSSAVIQPSANLNEEKIGLSCLNTA